MSKLIKRDPRVAQIIDAYLKWANAPIKGCQGVDATALDEYFVDGEITHDAGVTMIVRVDDDGGPAWLFAVFATGILESLVQVFDGTTSIVFGRVD